MKRHKLNSKVSNRNRGMFRGFSRKGSSKTPGKKHKP